MDKAFEKILEFIDEQIKIEESIAKSENEGHPISHQYGANCMNVVKKFVHEVLEEYKGGWIPCSERLPKEYGEYIVWWTDITKSKYYEIVEYEPSNGWIGDIPQAVEGKYSVIAWQPLPEPFKESD